MSAKWMILASVTGLVAASASAPAEAQYYPPPPQQYPPQQYPQQYPPQQYPPQQYPQQYPPQQQYPQYPQQQYPQQQYPQQQYPGGLTGGFINQVFGYGRYPHGNYGYETYGNQRYGIDQCARAVEQRLNGYAYNWYGGGNNYRRYRPSGRVEGITRVERKSYGLKVWGVASSGYGGYEGWNRPGYGTYGYNAGADLSFECKVYPSGQIRDIKLNRRSASWRGY